jgi:hypothetical protein
MPLFNAEALWVKDVNKFKLLSNCRLDRDSDSSAFVRELHIELKDRRVGLLEVHRPPECWSLIIHMLVVVYDGVVQG